MWQEIIVALAVIAAALAVWRKYGAAIRDPEAAACEGCGGTCGSAGVCDKPQALSGENR
ncbi:MAG: hypothetical protein KKB20_13710 [Proteobacteria bacterium]|nr:hypothetical protein [Pseudomonadota bacterium]